jgi:hypothetical protein
MAVQIDIGTLRVRPKDHPPLRVAQRWGEGRGEVLFNPVNVDGNCYISCGHAAANVMEITHYHVI